MNFCIFILSPLFLTSHNYASQLSHKLYRSFQQTIRDAYANHSQKNTGIGYHQDLGMKSVLLLNIYYSQHTTATNQILFISYHYDVPTIISM